MFTSEFTSRPNYREILQRYEARLRLRLREVGELLRRDYSDRVQRQVDVWGNAQQPNKPATQARKQKRYGHTIPLRAEWMLYNPALWTIRVTGRKVQLIAPVARQVVVDRLIAQGYRPPGFVGPMVPPDREEEVAALVGRAFFDALSVAGRGTG
jgi:hypothetical protein